MYAGGARGNGQGVAGLGPEYVPGGGHELGEHDRRGRGRPRLEVLARRGEGALQRPREREAREAVLERLQPAAVSAARDGARLRRQQRLGGAQHQPQREHAIPCGTAPRGGEQLDELLLARGGRADHATSRCKAPATSAGAMSPRQRWWPIGQRAVRSEEHTSELQSQSNLVCRLLLEKKKKIQLIKRKIRMSSS